MTLRYPGIVTLISLLCLLVACSDSGEQAAGGGGMPPAVVTLGKAEPGKMEEVLTIAGTLKARLQSMVSTEIDGIIKQVHVKDGQPVKKGELLFELDSATLQAELHRAEANVKLRLQEKKRVESLFKRNVASQYDVDKAVAELLTAEAERDYAKAYLAKASIRAPYDGFTGIRLRTEGNYVETGTRLIPLVVLDPIMLDFSAPETVLGVIDIDSTLTVEIPALGLKKPARIIVIEPLLSQTTRSVKVRGVIENDDKKLRPGLFARVSLPVRVVDGVLWLPESALFYEGDKTLVMIHDQGKAFKRSVKVAGFNNARVAISDGLDVNEEVVIAGHHKIAFDGAPIMSAEAMQGMQKNQQESPPQAADKQKHQTSPDAEEKKPEAANGET